MRFEDMVVGELDWLGRQARRYYENDADAEDLLGETICRMIENKNRYNDRYPFRPWARTVMGNIYVTAYNRRRCVLMCPIEKSDIRASESETDSEAEINGIVSVIVELAEKSVCVESVRLYAIEGLSYEETAKAMGVSVDVVRTRISTGRKIIKKALRLDKC